MRYPVPAPPVVGGIPKRHSGQNNKPPEIVVIHSAVMQCEPGAARKLGAWNRDGTTGGSWHYATDPDETIQCSYDRFVCHAAPPNPRKLHIEMADWPGPVPGDKPGTARYKALRRVWRWRNPQQIKMLKRTAKLTAQLCLAYDLPVKYLSVAEVRAGGKGITGHVNVSKAFGQSVHWDPGFWPRRRFMRLVRKYAQEIRND